MNDTLGTEIHDVPVAGWDESIFNFVYEHKDCTAQEVSDTFGLELAEVERRLENIRRRIIAFQRNGRDDKTRRWCYRVYPSKLG